MFLSELQQLGDGETLNCHAALSSLRVRKTGENLSSYGCLIVISAMTNEAQGASKLHCASAAALRPAFGGQQAWGKALA
jgi:hypothetical protein